MACPNSLRVILSVPSPFPVLDTINLSKLNIIKPQKNAKKKLLVKKKDKELKQMAKKISLDWLSDNVQGVSKIGITEEILKRIDGHL